MKKNAPLARHDWPWLTSLLLAGCLALAIFALSAESGVPLDDAWIHFQFARNLARGDGLSFNPGQPTSGSTAPLWTVLLAGVYFAGGRFPLAGQLLSAACYLATLAATYTLGKRVTGRCWAAWLAGMVVATNGRMVWAALSALEICLFSTLSLLAIHAHLGDCRRNRYRLRSAALFGLAALNRPEGYLLFALSVGVFVYHAIRTTQHATRITHYVLRVTSYLLHLASCILHLASCILPAITLFAALISPALIFSYHTSGRLLPNTYHAKATLSLLPDREFRDFLSVGAVYLILDNPLLLPCFLLGLILLIRRAPLLSLWCAGLPLAYAFIRASLYQHGRYLMPLIPCNGVVAAWGLMEIEKLIRRRPALSARLQNIRTRLGPLCSTALLSLLLITGTAWRLPRMAQQYAKNVAEVNHMHVQLGHWLAENTPPDAVLALNDIGAIAYISKREVVDLAGLVTPEVTPALRAPEQTGQLLAFLAGRDVAYVVIFPNWFPGLAESDDLEEIHRVTLAERTIAGGEEMVVYRFTQPRVHCPRGQMHPPW